METSKRKRLTLGLYLNYFVHGIGLIILAQNMLELGKLWGQPLAVVSYVISGVGIGRLAAYLLLGSLADRYGRKSFIYIGIGSYFIFFIGMLLVKDFVAAYLLAILAGIANSALDSGTYPVFLEMGTNNGASNILIKAFMSAGEFILPLVVSFLEVNKLWFGWSFVLAVIILVLNAIILFPVKFPEKNLNQEVQQQLFAHLPAWRRKGLAVLLSLYGYSSMALMIVYTQWISLYAEKQLHFSNLQAHLLLSLYSIGSIIGVIIVFLLLRKHLAETVLLISLNCLSLISLLVVNFTNNSLLVSIASLVFGMSAAGGIMQTGLNLFLKLFSKHKGLITGIFFTFGSLASFSIPLITGWLSKNTIRAVLEFDLLMALIGLLLSVGVRIVLGSEMNLEQTRKKITLIDYWVVRLLEYRFKQVKLVGRIKVLKQQVVLDEKREEAVLSKISAQSSNERLTPYLQDVYRHIMKNSRTYEAENLKKDDLIN
ncbi:MAG: MFS transporter [Liquorilactobacillus sp.]|uniref:MFS transporter n=1 Tax=Liquorilactobacillus sp. TaxID=2767923 RepID=UPI0039E954DE